MLPSPRESESPFLPGTSIQYSWDSTSLGWLKTCPRLYQYSMIEGWRSRGESVHLKFGQLYHSALEQYDKLMASAEVKDHDACLQIVVQTTLEHTWEWPTEPNTKDEPYVSSGGKPWSPDHPSKTRETLIRSVIWYLDHFKDDPAKTVVLANGKPAVELSFRMELDYGPSYYRRIPLPSTKLSDGVPVEDPPTVEKVTKPYVLCGHLDRVVEFTGGTYVMDRKTSGSTIGSAYFDQYHPSNQMSLYTIAAKVVYQTPVKGIIIDAVQIAVGFSRFSRGFTYRTDAETEEWLSNTKQWLTLAEEYATAEFWPMNDTACNNYGGCTFRKICSKSPEVRQKFLETDFVKRPWNPLEVR